MKTRWNTGIDKGNVLPEYPRPQMRRERFLNLNGVWRYAIAKGGAAPDGMEGDILVPFSPECALSGVNRALRPDEALWYEREFALPENWRGCRALLHFGAVDQTAEVFLNGHRLGAHAGGYTSFSFDMTPHLRENNLLSVKVRDMTDTSHHARGKQKTKRGGIWYTPQSGIWQSVWAEPVPETHIERLEILPLYDEGAVKITVFAAGGASEPCSIRCGAIEARGVSGAPIRIELGTFEPWSPENPRLYDFTAHLGEDLVESYFAMRKFSVEPDEKGVMRLFLNNAPYFHNGVLDQGYWPDGLYTAPSDEAMAYDILTMKRMGFNALRKHIKIEPMRWYYHCDRLGMLVWQDMPCGGGAYRPLVVTLPAFVDLRMSDGPKNYTRFAREDAEGRAQYGAELGEMVGQLYNCPCLAVWVPFNEGWGQFDAAKAHETVLNMDASRTVDHASGWHDQNIGAVKSLHVYFRPYRFRRDRKNRAVLLSEFGGYNYRIEGHCFNERDFGYKRAKSAEELLRAFRALYENEIAPAKREGLAAAIYTQLSDVEDELNGLLTYDREVVKLPPEKVREIMEKLTGEG